VRSSCLGGVFSLDAFSLAMGREGLARICEGRESSVAASFSPIILADAASDAAGRRGGRFNQVAREPGHIDSSPGRVGSEVATTKAASPQVTADGMMPYCSQMLTPTALMNSSGMLSLTGLATGMPRRCP